MKTGQPMKAKAGANGGSKRLGEMEGWCLQGHGVMVNTFEKSHTDSSGKKLPICRNCNSVGIYNPEKNIYKCNKCGDYADLALTETTKASIYFVESLASAGMEITRHLTPRLF
jgi:DNA-directed RNA polymerase beta subunit